MVPILPLIQNQTMLMIKRDKLMNVSMGAISLILDRNIYEPTPYYLKLQSYIAER